MIGFGVSGRRPGVDRPRGGTPAYVALALGVAAGCSSESPLGLGLAPDVDAAVRSVTSGELAAHVRVVAHDSMAGRRSPSAGEDAAAAYIGSSFYVSNAPFSVAATVAVLNMDMLRRNSPDSVAVIRSGPAIGAVADAVAARSTAPGLHVAADPWPGENLIQRSDQWSFIREGVAGLLITSGLYEDYHRRTDEPDRIDADKLERVTRLALLIMLDLADPDVWTPTAP